MSVRSYTPSPIIGKGTLTQTNFLHEQPTKRRAPDKSNKRTPPTPGSKTQKRKANRGNHIPLAA